MEAEKVFANGRRNLLEVTQKGGVDLKDVVSSNCTVYGTDPSLMTNSRLFARFLSRFRWYNPWAGVDEDAYCREHGVSPPSLDKAWAFYEYETLARYYTDESKPGAMIRADAGDGQHNTRLYPFFATPVKELKDFGIGVRLYFSTLLVLSANLLVAGFFNVPLMNYFWNYAAGGKEGIDNSIRGSAICDDNQWVQCDSCTNEYDYDYEAYRLDGGNALKNTCNVEDWLVPGVMSYIGTVVLLCLCGFWFFHVQRKAEVAFDEDMQTASDYAVKVSNPPPDATDPDEWKKFFQRFCEKGVVSVTIVLNNAKLISALVKRRAILKKLKAMLPLGIDLSDRVAVANAVSASVSHRFCNLSFLFGSAESSHQALLDQEEKIRRLMTERYKAVAVYVVFETEQGQRNALHALSTGKLSIWQNTLDKSKFKGNTLTVQEVAESVHFDFKDVKTVLDDKRTVRDRAIKLVQSTDSKDDIESAIKFRGTKVLSVKESCEPNDVRWKDLEVNTRTRAFQVLITTAVLMVFIVWSGIFVYNLEKAFPGSYHTPLFITITNLLVPKVGDKLNAFEAHSTDGGRQISLYIKIAVFRCFNSGIILSIFCSFYDTVGLEDNRQELSLTHVVYPVIFAELLTVPLLKLLDIVGNIRKHILAPRARDQEEMNACFIGGRFDLAERYTDATKILFVSLYYSAVLPESLFLGALALFIHFGFGKFCLLRIWRQSPDIGPVLAQLSRNFFFSGSLAVHIVMSAYWWSGYPYDKVCEVDGEYQYCNQDFFGAMVFPPLPRWQSRLGMEWMTTSQATITSLYSWSSLVVVILTFGLFVRNVVLPVVSSVFHSTYAPEGIDQGVDFSAVKHTQRVHGFIPQVKEAGFDHPLLVCDISGIDTDLVGWKVKEDKFDRYNLYQDATALVDDLPPHPTFSIVKQWAPQDRQYQHPQKSNQYQEGQGLQDD